MLTTFSLCELAAEQPPQSSDTIGKRDLSNMLDSAGSFNYSSIHDVDVIVDGKLVAIDPDLFPVSAIAHYYVYALTFL